MEKKVKDELKKTVSGMEKDLTEQIGGMKYNRTLPEHGWKKDQVLKEIGKCMQLGKSLSIYRIESSEQKIWSFIIIYIMSIQNARCMKKKLNRSFS